MHALIRKIQEERFPHLKKEEKSYIVDKYEQVSSVSTGDETNSNTESFNWGKFLKNNAHIAQFSARPNVDDQNPNEVSMAFGMRIFPKLTELLGQERAILRQKALLGFIELFMQKKENIISALEAGAMEPCMDLIDDPDVCIRENALCAMGFLVSVKAGTDEFIKEGYIEELKPCIDDEENPIASRNALRVMKILSRNSTAAAVLRDSGCIPLLVSCASRKIEMITHSDHRNVLVECLRTLQNALTAEDSHKIALESNAVPALHKILGDMEVLRSSALLGCDMDKEVHAIVAAACTCVAYICFNIEGTQAVIAVGMYRVLIPLMNHTEENIREISTAALMYITIDKEGKKQCISEGVIPVICNIVRTEKNHTVLLNSLKLMCNVCQSLQGRRQLVESNVIESLETKKEENKDDQNMSETITRAIRLIRWKP